MEKIVIDVCTVRSENPLDFLLRLHKKYGVVLEFDPYSDDVNSIPGYDPSSTKNDTTEIELFSVPKGTTTEEVERVCKNLGFMRLIDPLELLHLVKRHAKYLYEHGDPNRIQLPFWGIRTQWKNEYGKWCFMEYKSGVLTIDLIYFENGIISDHEEWNFMGVRSCRVFYDRARQKFA